MFDPEKMQLSPKELADAILSRIDLPEKQKGLQLKSGTSADIAEAKEIDDLAFGVHHGISEQELQEVIDNGSLILLRDEDGRLIGESQVITNNCDLVKYKLAENEGFAYGTGIHPDEQGRGLGRITGDAQRLLAKEAGKEIIVGTIRTENYSSVRSRFKQGYQIEGYDPTYYGPTEEGGARLIIKSTTDKITKSGDEFLEGIKTNSIPEFNGTNLNEPLLRVPVALGDNVDLKANQQIETLIGAGYKGVWIFKNGEISEDGDNGQGLFVFKKEQKDK